MKKLVGFFIYTVVLFSCNNEQKAAEDATPKASPETVSTEIKDYDFGDSKFVDIGKKGLANLASGDIDGWMTSFADNAIYRWNGGDSLSGKAAIAEYWKKRMAEVIDSISFTNEVWLPMKVNKPLIAAQLPGNYALGWYMLYAKYKTGKTMSQRSHMVIHFDANDKIDRTTLYIDRAPINAAMAK